MKEFTLQLTEEEIGILFQALGERPFNQVFELIGKINDQVNQQYRREETGAASDQAENDRKTDG